MQQNLQNKKGLVENVFNQVYNKYDLMNDFMSMGIHRYWKKSLINMMNPRINRKLIDVACGTGDVGKLFLDNTSKEVEITCVDPNIGMVSQGKQKLSNYKNVKWVISPAEKLPIAIIIIPIEANIIATHTLKEIFSCKNKKPKKAVINGIAARHNKVTAAEVFVIDQIKLLIAMPKPVPPIKPDQPILL